MGGAGTDEPAFHSIVLTVVALHVEVGGPQCNERPSRWPPSERSQSRR